MQTKELPTMKLEVLPGFKFKPGWGTVKDTGSVVGEPILTLSEFFLEGEEYVLGEEMLERAEEMGNLAGQFHAERLLEQQDQIPVEWRSHVLVFAGTVRRVNIEHLYVPYLFWDGRGWNLDFYWLDADFLSGDRLVRLGNKLHLFLNGGFLLQDCGANRRELFGSFSR